ncbi:ATP-binding protein [Streptomonospora sp. PA3]|uniref:ATP-binding protein n=1 Tax=Streptomonospora sp. PA3 TaxID=2607326 RepID=UPI0012DE3477|nr:ATP-binding protein [Streptomonospora sp. PA3]MUL40429.1 ATP-binding protein [Streptomonospora sp. PA3]
MEVKFSIALPRQAYTVAVMRDFLGEALRTTGVCAECRFPILLAASEACANAVDHGAASAGYRVEVHIRSDMCVVEVAHIGPGFNLDRVPLPDLEAESGRGILLMRQIMDDVSLASDRDGTTRLRLGKRFDECSPGPPEPGRWSLLEPVLR